MFGWPRSSNGLDVADTGGWLSGAEHFHRIPEAQLGRSAFPRSADKAGSGAGQGTLLAHSRRGVLAEQSTVVSCCLSRAGRSKHMSVSKPTGAAGRGRAERGSPAGSDRGHRSYLSQSRHGLLIGAEQHRVCVVDVSGWVAQVIISTPSKSPHLPSSARNDRGNAHVQPPRHRKLQEPPRPMEMWLRRRHTLCSARTAFSAGETHTE